MSRTRAAFLGGLIMAVIYTALTGCTEPLAPIVTCHENIVQTPQGPWHAGRYCESTNPATGQGHAVKP